MVGLSEMGEGLLRRAHAVHPVSAMQSEYSLLTRNPEIAVLDACKELGVDLRAVLAGRARLSRRQSTRAEGLSCLRHAAHLPALD